ncbi:hypothetical protein CsSME_00027832 [Camellia sinensis var. sinensis]
MGQQLQQQKEEVRKMLVAANDQLSQKLNFINAIQRLGVSYHFENNKDIPSLVMCSTNSRTTMAKFVNP